MNRRAIVIGGATAGAALFAGGAWYVTRQRQAEQQAAVQTTLAAQPDALIRPHSPILGQPDAPVTLVEFFDPSCEACRAYHPLVNTLLGEHREELRVVLRYTPFHEGSDEAVRILETARSQSLFEPVLDALFEQQPVWAVHGTPRMDLAWQIAGQAGLNLEQAQKDRLRPDITSILNQDMADVESMQIRATPTFFVGTERLNDLSPDSLRTRVVEAVSAQIDS